MSSIGVGLTPQKVACKKVTGRQKFRQWPCIQVFFLSTRQGDYEKLNYPVVFNASPDADFCWSHR